MTVSPELQKMADRAKLPISVRYLPQSDSYCLTGKRGGHGFMAFSGWPESAAALYLDLVSTLESAGPSPAVTDGGCSAPASPGGEL
jgi:hypothetical protein